MVFKNYIICLLLALNIILINANLDFSRKLQKHNHRHNHNHNHRHQKTKRHSSQTEAENVILIILDDLGVEVLSQYRDDVIDVRSDFPDMPTLDNLVKDGVRFVNAYSAPTCSPSRAMMYTGKLPFKTGVGCPVGAVRSTELSLDETTVFQLLQKRGYKTGIFGKWHLNQDDEDNDEPRKLGFDVHDGLYVGALLSYYSWNNTRNGDLEIITDDYVTSYQTNRALDWLGENKHNKFALVMSYIAPHTPIHKPPNELINTQEFKDLPFVTDLRNSDADVIPYFFAMLESVDNEIGRLLDSLDSKVREKTSIIILGDNGTDRVVVRENENKPYTSSKTKNTVYEGGIRVPLVISGAGVTKCGKTETGLVSLVDIFATILDLVHETDNVKYDKDEIDSISVYPALCGNFMGREYIYSEQFGYCYQEQIQEFLNDQQSVRDEKFKYIIIDYDQDSIKEEFYDIVNDPVERVNLLNSDGNIDPNANDRTVVYVDLDLAAVKLKELKDKLISINNLIPSRN